MKTLNLLITGLILFSPMLNAQKIDRTKPPKPGPAPKINFGKSQKFTLDNGLKVIVVENHKIPIVSIQLFVDYDPVLEKEKAGLSDVFGQMLATGSKEIPKEELDKTIDLYGARFITTEKGFYLYALSKYIDPLMNTISRSVLNPAFDKSEFEKVINKTLSSLEAEKKNPSFMANNATAAVMYGKNHPYGEVPTEETIKNITPDDCKKFFETYFKPNFAYLIITGDLSLEDAKHIAYSFFNEWQAGDPPRVEYPEVKLPGQQEFVLVDKKGAVQSQINVAHPVKITPRDPDYVHAQLMNGILGNAGFQARLMQNIREDKGYTYGAYSTLSPDKLIGEFKAFASVRTEVTDSAIVEFIKEIKRMTTEKVSDEELENVKRYYSGNFALNLEKPETIARFALNIERYGLPEDYYETYLQKVERTSSDEILSAAKKYLKPDNLYVVVAGNKSAIEDKLKQLAPDHKLRYFDAFGNEIKDTPKIPEGITAEVVIRNYIDAIGGEKKLKKVKTLKTVMNSKIRGADLQITVAQAKPGKFATIVNVNGMVMQKITYDGKTGKTSGMQGNKELTGDELKEIKEKAQIFSVINYLSGDYKLKLTGIEKVNDRNAYVVEITSPDGKTSTEYYDTENFLRLRSITTTKNPQAGELTSINDYSDYREVDGIKFPFKIVQDLGIQKLNMEVTSIEVNKKLPSDIFQ